MLIENLLKAKSMTEVLTIPHARPAADAVATMNEHRVGALLVTDDAGVIQGIITERDILRKFRECAAGASVEEVMTPRSRLIIGHKKDSLDYAMKVFTENRVRHLPIFDGDSLVGLISIGDALKAHLKEVEFDNKMLEDYVNGASLVIG